MNITIDGIPLEERWVVGGNLEHLLNDINRNHIPQNRTIVEVRVNGETYWEPEPHAAASFLRSDIRDLAILTQSPTEVALHFMENATAIVAEIAGMLPRINERLRIGDGVGGNDLLVDFLNSFQLLVKVITRVDEVFPGFLYQSTPLHPPLYSQLEAINSLLDAVIDDQESQDWDALADHLEFQLLPALERMGQTLGGLEDWVKNRPAAYP